MTPATTSGAALLDQPGGWLHGLRYGLLGLPLAFVALPLYVVWPNHYAREFGVSLAALGAVLLGARLLDAFIDPLIGRWCDATFRRSVTRVLVLSGLASGVLALGFAGLFFPPAALGAGTALLAWAVAGLLITYTAYSVVSVAHQSWGAMLGGTEAQRARVVAWREALGLVGVVTAAVLPTLAGLGATVVLFAVLLALGCWAWSAALRPVPDVAPQAGPAASVWAPLRQPAFVRLLGVFLVNGIASAVPATLVLFFVQDQLQAPAAMEPAFLGTYFVCAAASMPLWLRVVARVGLARAWRLGMGVSVGVFAWAAFLGPGDVWAFLAVCALSGLALGADLAVPGALLAGLVGDMGERGRGEGRYFGWWNFATKLNLALAAGLALPLLDWWGYAPGQRDPQALTALTWAYCILPCVLKLAAAAGLQHFIVHKENRT
jgi:GPH family glycoside/pentoside/hexuronide:cation symporter